MKSDIIRSPHFMQLFEHQKAALDRLHNGSILWGGTGSGKSITGLAYYFDKVCENMHKPKDLYIITTARKRDTFEWEGECARFGLSTDPSASYKGTHVAIDSWNNIKKYTSITGCFFIFDEQRVVGYGAWTKAFLKITARNQWILLSATPGDCWMDYLPVFIANGFVKNKTEFQRLYVIYNRFNTRYPQIRGYCNIKQLEKFRDSILVGMSFEKSTVPHNMTIRTGYSKALYDIAMKHRFNPYTEEPIKEASELCYTLRRIVNSDPERANAITRILFEKRRAIIFYNYNYELGILRETLLNISWPFAEWNGQKHEPLPTGGRWAYLVQYTAGAEGWNCIETDTVIFYSQNYSYKTMVQAAGRIDRLNTAYHDLYYYYLTSDSKIDLAMARALKNKKNFNESAFIGGSKPKSVTGFVKNEKRSDEKA